MSTISRDTFEQMEDSDKLNILYDILTNHLSHHSRILRFVLYPLAVGIGVLLFDKFIKVCQFLSQQIH